MFANQNLSALPLLDIRARRAWWLLALTTTITGCKASITTEISSKKAATFCPATAEAGALVPGCEPMVIDGVQPLVIGPGDTITLKGRYLRPTLTLAANGTETTSPAAVSDSQATFVVPKSLPFGPAELTLTQDGVTQKVTLFANGGKTDHPIFTAGADQICQGVKFYDASGTLKTGSKNCVDLPEAPPTAAPTAWPPAVFPRRILRASVFSASVAAQLLECQAPSPSPP